MAIDPISPIGSVYLPPISPIIGASNRHVDVSLTFQNAEGTMNISRNILEDHNGAIIGITETVSYSYDRFGNLQTIPPEGGLVNVLV